ncbi:MAG: DUF4446 family protein [Candidatus Limnocylindria bacterium]
MDDLNRLLADNLALVVGVMAAVIVLLIVALVAQGIRLGRAVRAYRQLVSNGSGGSLHEVLDAHIGQVGVVGRRLDELQALHELIEHRTLTSLQHIGLVRFNPFEDTGSDQSFAIALLDDERDGIVLSSLHGRTNTRLFAKPVSNGASPHNLSDEETQAIRIAVEGTRPG